MGTETQPAVSSRTDPSLLCFAVDRDLYGVELRAVGEVLKAARVLVLPGLPGHVAGVISVRGAIIPVVDLRRRLGKEPAGEPAKVVLILRSGEKRVGLLIGEPPFIEAVAPVDHRGPERALVEKYAASARGVFQVLRPEPFFDAE